jgi:hypothetical protein
MAEIHSATALDRLRTHARVLHRAVQAQQPDAIARLRFLPELPRPGDVFSATDVKRRHCLTVVAREFGFDHWLHAVHVLTGVAVRDFGKLLYPSRCEGRTHFWSVSYADAQQVRAQDKGYLLPYQRQCFVVTEHYIKALGLDPLDPDWELIDRDWIQPREPQARQRLYGKVIAAAIEHLAEWGPLFAPTLRDVRYSRAM